MRALKSEQVDINAIAEKELREVLVAHSLEDSVLHGTATCVMCGEPVDWFTIAGLLVKEDGLKIVCNRAGCVEGVVSRSDG